MPEIHELIRRPEVHSVQKEQMVLDVVQFMTQMNVGAVSVLEGENLVGIFSSRDLLLYDISQKDDEIHLMRAFTHYVPPSTPAGHES